MKLWDHFGLKLCAHLRPLSESGWKKCLVGRDRERGILIAVRDPGTGFPGQFPGCTVGENVYSNHGCGSNLNSWIQR
jgi:hypothetical protein